jgi:hypothetical protein
MIDEEVYLFQAHLKKSSLFNTTFPEFQIINVDMDHIEVYTSANCPIAFVSEFSLEFQILIDHSIKCALSFPIGSVVLAA